MAVSLVGPGSTTGNTALASSRSVAVPNNGGANPLQANDVVVVRLSRWDTSINPAVTAPSGFVHLTQVTNTGGGKVDTYLKRLTAADTGTYPFSWTGSMWTTATARAYRGVDPAATLTAVPLHQPTNTGTTAWPAATLSSVGNGVLDWHGYSESNGNPHTVPTTPAFTKLTDNDSDVGAYFLASAGSYTTSGGSAVANSNNIVSMLHLPEASSGVSMALGPAAGSGAAQALSSAKAVTTGQAAGSGTAQALTASKDLALGPSAGSGTAQASSFAKTVTLGVPAGTGAPQAMSFSKDATLGPAAGAGAVQPLAPGKDLGLQTATGSGAAQAMSFGASGQLTLGTAAGTGAPQPMSFSKGLALGVATGVGAMQALSNGKGLQLGVAAGAGSPRALAAAKPLALAAVQGSGQPRPLAFAGPTPEYDAPTSWSAVTRPGPLTAARASSFASTTRRTPYVATTREKP